MLAAVSDEEFLFLTVLEKVDAKTARVVQSIYKFDMLLHLYLDWLTVRILSFELP